MQTSTPSDDYFVPLVGSPSAFAPPVPVTTRYEKPKRLTGPMIALGVVVLASSCRRVLRRCVEHVARRTQTPVVLAPHAATAGLPASLGDVVRMQAESSRVTPRSRP